MKRQVAGLPPVRQDIFEQKVQQRQGDDVGSSNAAVNGAPAATAGPSSSQSERSRCQECGKSFASANSYTTHLNSRKHKETVAKLAAVSVASNKASVNPPPAATSTSQDPFVFSIPSSAASALTTTSPPLASLQEIKAALPNTVAEAPQTALSPEPESKSTPQAPTSLTIAEDATDAEVEAAIAARLSAATRIDPAKQCIFCPTSGFEDLEASLDHMQRQHGFFVPERPYLIDLPGLAQYLADKVSVGHLCLYCNGRGRGFNTAEAVRKHMLDKYHCKVAYDREEDQLELSDFYDFSSSYPDYQSRGTGEAAEGEEWEDMDEDGIEGSEGSDMDDDDDAEDADLAPNGLRYGDSELELVLPSGARLGHRSLARYYRQTLFSTPAAAYGGGGGAVARRLIDQGRAEGRGSDLVVRDRNGGEVRARNRGEAKEAKRHIREFRDMNRREQFKTQVGYRNNNQKHFRDPLLQ
ncbi:unnamed protein product [Parajaminaea phylloscopi]